MTLLDHAVPDILLARISSQIIAMPSVQCTCMCCASSTAAPQRLQKAALLAACLVPYVETLQDVGPLLFSCR